MDNTLYINLLYEGLFIPQNTDHPIAKAVEAFSRGLLTWDEEKCARVLREFNGNRQAMALWITGFTTAIALLERDERLG